MIGYDLKIRKETCLWYLSGSTELRFLGCSSCILVVFHEKKEGEKELHLGIIEQEAQYGAIAVELQFRQKHCCCFVPLECCFPLFPDM